jgi:starch synthase
VPIEQVQDGTGTPVDPDAFVRDMAAALVDAVSDPARARVRGQAGRLRAQQDFAWSSIAERTAAVYAQVLATG